MCAAADWRSWLCFRIQDTRYILGQKRSMVGTQEPSVSGLARQQAGSAKMREEKKPSTAPSRIGGCRLVHSQQQAIPAPRHCALIAHVTRSRAGRRHSANFASFVTPTDHRTWDGLDASCACGLDGSCAGGLTDPVPTRPPWRRRSCLVALVLCPGADCHVNAKV